MKKSLLILSLCALLAAELPAQENNAQPWTPARLEHTAGGDDPIGGYNRAVFAVNDFCVKWIVRPVGIAWTTILPRPVIEVIDNMCTNLGYPRRVFSCLGAAEWVGAWDETVRFFVNSTIGIAGMFDPAKHWMHYYSTESDFNRMLEVWGVGPGCTFMFPFTTIVNVRGAAGAILDYAFDGRTYLPYTSWTYVNEVVLAEKDYAKVMLNATDRYHTFRLALLAQERLRRKFYMYHAANDAWEQMKAAKEHPAEPAPDVIPPCPEGVVNPVHIPAYVSQSSMRDTIRALLFRPLKDDDFWYMRLSAFNSDFEKKLEKIRIGAEDNPYEFYFRTHETEKDAPPPDKPAELVLLLPGIGANKESAVPLAMAELLYDSGRSVAIFDSAFTPAFMNTWGRHALPGYLPRDTDRMADMLTAALKHLKETKKIPEDVRVSVVGWSFGGIQTLFLAARKHAQLKAVRYLALNPPVDLDYALSQADSLTRVSASWTQEEAFEKITDALGRALVMQKLPPPAEGSTPALPVQVPLSDDQCRFLTALSFGGCLREILLTQHLRAPLPGLKTGTEMPVRMALLEEIDNVSFGRYVREFLMADADFKSMKYEELAKKSSLRALESELKNAPAVRVIHTADDFLLNAADRAWLSRTFGDRLVWFDRGGHLGNLYTETVRNRIPELLK